VPVAAVPGAEHRNNFFSLHQTKLIFTPPCRKQIVQNVIRYIKKNGYFLYVTCSVFKKENTVMVDFIIANSNLQLIKKEVLIGYDKKADTMFGALFKNPL
jgi:16S rRNA (cytosine967-C5)-methyltransferase